jgi:hypothetical protein
MGTAGCLLCCPIGGMVGCCSAACNFWGCFSQKPWPSLDCGNRNWTVPATCVAAFVAAFVLLYLPLTVFCAYADHEHWKLVPDGMECVISAGGGPYARLGLYTGLIMGTGIMGASLAGFIVTTVAVLWCGRGRRTSGTTGTATTIASPLDGGPSYAIVQHSQWKTDVEPPAASLV